MTWRRNNYGLESYSIYDEKVIEKRGEVVAIKEKWFVKKDAVYRLPRNIEMAVNGVR